MSKWIVVGLYEDGTGRQRYSDQEHDTQMGALEERQEALSEDLGIRWTTERLYDKEAAMEVHQERYDDDTLDLY